MKTPLFKSLVTLFVLFSALVGCREKDVTIEKDAITPFFVKDISGQVLSNLDPEVLTLVQKDLIEKKRLDDAKNLLLTYDAQSGKLRPEVGTPNKGAKPFAAYDVTIDGYSRNIGWRYGITLGNVVGTEGQGLRLEAFRLNFNPFNLNPFAPDPYAAFGAATITYEAHLAGIGWQGQKNPSEIAGTIGQSRAIQAVRFFVNPNFATQVFYRSHCSGYGWFGWQSNGGTSGTTGTHADLEAFQLTMLIY